VSTVGATTPTPNAARRRQLRFVVWALTCAAAWGGLPGPSHAYFERVVTSARNVALGRAFVGVADDPSAVAINPAGLALMQRPGALATYDQPYNVTGLDGGFAAAAVPVKKAGVLGASWHHLGLDGALSENLITLGFARHLIATTQDASLSVGLRLDFMRAAADQTARSDHLVTGGFGVLLRPFPSIGMGYAIQNVRRGDIQLLGGGPGTRVRRQQAWGLALEWNGRVTVNVQRSQTATGEWKNHTGVEIDAHPNLQLRGGLDGRYLAGGFGVLWKGLRADVAVTSHDWLGATYVFSIAYLPKVKSPYARR
jgi:hypothetical protein